MEKYYPAIDIYCRNRIYDYIFDHHNINGNLSFATKNKRNVSLLLKKLSLLLPETNF